MNWDLPRLKVPGMRGMWLWMLLVSAAVVFGQGAQGVAWRANFAGSSGNAGFQDGVGSAVRFNGPSGMAADPNGVVFVADTLNHVIRKLSADGSVFVYAGNVGAVGAGDSLTTVVSMNPTGALGGSTLTLPAAASPSQLGIFPGMLVSGRGVVAGTKVVAVNGNTLTLSSALTVSASGAYSFTGTVVNAAEAQFNAPRALTADRTGSLYVADTGNHTIRRVTPQGGVVTIAGKATVSGYVNGMGNVARFNTPAGVALGIDNALYVADTGNHVIRRVDAAGSVTLFAGIPNSAGSADGAVSAAKFNAPQGLWVDSAGNVYVADTGNHLIRKITVVSGVATRVDRLAGTALQVGSGDGAATVARFNQPVALVGDANGDLLVSDRGNQLVRRVTMSGAVSTVGGQAGMAGAVDGVGTASKFNEPTGIVRLHDGRILVANRAAHSISIGEPGPAINTTGFYNWFPLAGSGGGQGTQDGELRMARFVEPGALCADGQGNLYLLDNQTVRRVSVAGQVSTLAGRSGVRGAENSVSLVASFAMSASAGSTRVTLASASDTAENIGLRSGMTLAGAGVPTGTVVISVVDSKTFIISAATSAAFSGNYTISGATSGLFKDPAALALDLEGNVLVADTGNHAIRKISPAGVVTTVGGVLGNSVTSTASPRGFNGPKGIAVGADGALYVADTGNHTIRRLSAGGQDSIIAGVEGASGVDSGPLGVGRLSNPSALACAGSTLFVVEEGQHTVRKVDLVTQNLTPLAGTPGSAGFSDGVPGSFNAPRGIAVDAVGSVYVADSGNQAVRVIRQGSGVFTVAGAGEGYADGAASSAKFRGPAGIALVGVAGMAGIYVSDPLNFCIRRIRPSDGSGNGGGTLTVGGGGVGTGGTAIAGGTLTLNTGSTGTTSGTFSLADASFSGGALTLVGGTNLGSGGTLNVSGGTFALSGGGTLNVSAGTYSSGPGGGTLTVSTGTLTLSGGTGGTAIGSGGVFSVSGGTLSLSGGATSTSGGMLTVTGGTTSGTLSLSGATIGSNGGTLVQTGVTTGTTGGTLTLSGGTTGTTDGTLVQNTATIGTNGGTQTVGVVSGGTLNLSPAPFSGGTLQLAGGSGGMYSVASGSLTVLGSTLSVSGGTLSLTNGTTGTTSGTLTLSGGSLSSSGGQMGVSAGTLNFTGVTASANAGTLTLSGGTVGGTLTLIGGTTGGTTGGTEPIILTYTDTSAAETFATVTGTVAGTVLGTGGTLTYGIKGAFPAGSLDFGSSTGKSLTVADGDEFRFGTGDFTIETWAYVRAGGNFTFYDSGGDVDSPGSFAFWCEGGELKIRIDGTSSDLGVQFDTALFNQWAHYAVVRRAGVITIFVNGVAVVSGDRPQNITKGSPCLGRLQSYEGYDLEGKISNFRMIKGGAIYMANFAPPSGELAVVPGTVLLLRAASAAQLLVDSSGFNHTVANNGGVAFDPSGPILGRLVTEAGGVVSQTGPFGTLSVNVATGAYTFTPDAQGINALRVNGGDGFIVTMSDGLVVTQKALNVSVTAANDAPMVVAPASFFLSAVGMGDLVYNGAPFTDVDNASLMVTLIAGEGTIIGGEGSGITVGGTVAAPTFFGTVADLNAYFTKPGRITYQSALNGTGSRMLTTTVSDGSLSASATSTINFTGGNNAPALAPIALNGTEDTPLNFTAVHFATAYSNAGNRALESITVVTLPGTGTLKLNGVALSPGQVIPLSNLNKVPIQGLIGRWSFDSADDLGKNSVTGAALSNSGGATWSANGKSGGAVDFDGASLLSAISGTIDNLPVGDSNYSVALWFKARSFGSKGFIGWGAYGGSNQVNAFRLNGDGLLLNYWWDNDLSAAVATMSPQTWYHVVATYNGSERAIHFNGQKTAFDSVSGANVEALNFAIGKTYGDEYFDGLIDEVLIYSRALSVTEIAALAADSGSSGGGFTYEPAPNDNGPKTFTVTASDGSLSSDVATVTINLAWVNDAPTVAAPISFTVSEGVAGSLTYIGTPFGDVDSSNLTVTLSVDAGILNGGPAAGVTVGGTSTVRTFAGTASALNAYFTTPGNVTYQGVQSIAAGLTLTTSVSDGALSASAQSTINFTTGTGGGTGGGTNTGAGLTVDTYAGGSAQGGNADGSGAEARFGFPQGAAVDSNGNLYVADTDNHAIRKISRTGEVTTLVGGLDKPGDEDGSLAQARFQAPGWVAIDRAGNLYVTDIATHKIRKITMGTTPEVSTLAGSGTAGSTNGPALTASFNQPTGIAVDGAGNVYVADSGNFVVRKVSVDGVVTTLAGVVGAEAILDGPALSARFGLPVGIAVDEAGATVFVGEASGVIRKISGGAVATLNTQGSSGTQSGLVSIAGMALDTLGNLYVADYTACTIHKITAFGEVSTIGGMQFQSGNTGGLGQQARFSGPVGVAVQSDGTLYVTNALAKSVFRAVPPLVTKPILAGPVSNAVLTANAVVSFVLPQTAQAGSVKLEFKAGTVVRTLTLSAGQQSAGMHSFSFSPAAPTIGGAVASVAGGTSLPNGTYAVKLFYKDSSGATFESAVASNVVVDGATAPPVISSPVANRTYNPTITISFSLPEAAAPGTVGIGFFDGVTLRLLRLAASQETAGAHTFVLDPLDPTKSSEVASGDPIPAGVYTFGVTYQDAVGNPEAVTTKSGVTLNFPVATLASPAKNTVSKAPVNVQFSLPAAAKAGSVKLSFSDGTTPRVLQLADSERSAGSHRFSFDPSNPEVGSAAVLGGVPIPDGVYAVTLSYVNAANVASSAPTATGFRIDTRTLPPTLVRPAVGSSSGTSMQVEYSLPEVAQPGSLRLVFSAGGINRVLVLADTECAAGSHGFTLDLADPTSSEKVASGVAIPDGVYSVVLSYRDLLGNADALASASRVTVDGFADAPTLTVSHVRAGSGKPLQFSFSLPEAAMAGSVTLTFTGTNGAVYTMVLGSGFNGEGPHRIGFDPAAPLASGVFSSAVALPTGAYKVVLKFRDLQGNLGTSIPVGGVRVNATAALSLDSSDFRSAGGLVGSDFPGAKFVSFGVPSAYVGGVAFGGIVADAANLRRRVVYAGTEVVARQGAQAPGAAFPFQFFGVPVVNNSGNVAFTATLESDEPEAGLWVRRNGVLGLVFRSRMEVPDHEGLYLGGVSELVLADNGDLVFTAPLTVVSEDPDAQPDPELVSLWRQRQGEDGTLTLTELLSQGDTLSVVEGDDRVVRSIALFASLQGTLDQRRGYNSSGVIVARVGFEDGSCALVKFVGEGLELLVQSGAPLEILGGASIKSFSLPTLREDGSVVFLARLDRDSVFTTPPDVALDARNDSVIIEITGEGEQLTLGLRARKGVTLVEQDGGPLGAIGDPVPGPDGAVAFLGTALAGQGAGVLLPPGKTGLLRVEKEGDLSLLAREGGVAPGAGGAKFAAIRSMAWSEGDARLGPAFVATLQRGADSVTTANDIGFWVQDAAGDVQLLLREGDKIDLDGTVRTVRSFTVLSAAPGCASQGHSTRGDGKFAVRVIFMDANQSVLLLNVPFNTLP